MSKTFAVIAVGLAAAMGSPCEAAPLEAYGRLPSIEQAAISPDGALLAFIVTDGEKRAGVIKRIADNKIVGGFVAGTQKVRTIQWAGSNHLLVTASSTTEVAGLDAPLEEWRAASDYDLAKHKFQPLLNGMDETLNAILDTPMIRIIDGKPFAFVQAFHFVSREGRISLFKVDLDQGTSRLVRDGFAHTQDWLVDSGGGVLAESEFDPRAKQWTLKIGHGMGWKVVKTLSESISPPEILGLGRDARSVLLDDSVEDRPVLRELAPEASDWGAPLSVQDSQETIVDPTTEALIGVHSLIGDEDRYTFFDPLDQKSWNAAVKAYPGSRVTLVSMSADHQKFVVMADSPTEGPDYALVDIATRKGVWLGGTYDSALKDLAPVTPIAFKATDGTPLTGYLTLPKGREAKGLPLVVFPHGGPAARDEPSFDWWAQAMASRGYAVLQVNYRGSDGFGWAFLSAGFGQWGRKMQTDLSDGVRYLATQGKIDPARVCIVGASYGGYAALAGATLEPGVYRCAVSVAGLSDLRRFVAWDKDRTDVSVERYWLRYMGVDQTRDPRLEDVSPVDHVAAVKIPVLLIHGKDDTVVPFEQSRIMADALQRAGKPVELVTLKHEDHWLSTGDTRLQMLQATIAFLEKNNPP